MPINPPETRGCAAPERATTLLGGNPDMDWWRGAVIYQIYPRSFADSTGSGVGDLVGLMQRLNHVADLGADAVWISPFVASPQRDHGYDVSDYCAVDPLFGSVADAEALIDRAHCLGLRVLMDQVWAHTSDEHPWFGKSRAARDGACADWYVWADAREDGTPPNNWLSVFGGPAWTWDPRRRQYYLHHFLAAQPALNCRHPDVQQALLDVATFWLQRGVDGFRLDAVDFMAHDPSLRSNPPRWQASGDDLTARPVTPPTKPYSYQRHLYDLAHSDTIDILSRLRQGMAAQGTWRGEEPLTVAEVGSEPCHLQPFERAAAYTCSAPRQGRHQGPLHMAYSLAMMKTDGDVPGLAALITDAEAVLGDGWLMWAFSNHDVMRVVSRWGQGDPASAPCFLALLMSLRGAVCLYQGEELGLPEARLEWDQLQDPVGIALWPDHPGRDGARTPMPWTSGGRSQGFSSQTDLQVDPWLPVVEDHAPLAVDRQLADPRSVLHSTRALLAWRKGSTLLQQGDIRVISASAPFLILERRLATRRMVVLFNLSADRQTLPDHPDGGSDRIIWQAVPGVWRGPEPAGNGGASVSLDGWGAACWDSGISTES